MVDWNNFQCGRNLKLLRIKILTLILIIFQRFISNVDILDQLINTV